MTNDEKALLYDDLLRESDRLQRVNSKLKSEYVTNIPPNVQNIIDENNAKIAVLVNRLENLLR
jgi:hypothetical protein